MTDKLGQIQRELRLRVSGGVRVTSWVLLYLQLFNDYLPLFVTICALFAISDLIFASQVSKHHISHQQQFFSVNYSHHDGHPILTTDTPAGFDYFSHYLPSF